MRGVRSLGDAAHAIIVALSRAFPEREGEYQSFAMAASDDMGSWLRVLRSLWAESMSRSSLLIIENAEHTHANPAIRDLLCALLTTRQDHRKIIVCTRSALPFHHADLAAGTEILQVHAHSLQFTRSEVAEFMGQSVDAATVDNIWNTTFGWPLLVSFAVRAQESNEGYFDTAHHFTISSDPLITAVIEQSIATLSPEAVQIVLAASSIPECTVQQAKALFPEIDSATYSELAPFISVTSDQHFMVHPRVQDVVKQIYHVESRNLLLRAALQAERTACIEEAARLYLLAGEPHSAARMLPISSYAPFVEPPDALLSAIQQLDVQTLLEHPRLWYYSVTIRAASIDSEQWIREGYYVWEHHRHHAAKEDLSALLLPMTNALWRVGRLQEAQAFLTDYCAFVGDAAGDSAAVKICEGVIQTYLGINVDIDDLQKRIKIIGNSPAWLALGLYDVIARTHRFLCDRARERETLFQAMELGKVSKTPFVRAWIALDAAVGAWIAGEDALFQKNVHIVEQEMNPFTVAGTQHFIDCVRGRGLNARTRSEKIKVRCTSWIIAASLASDPDDRLRLARLAVIAAEQSSQPYYQVIAHLALGFCDPHHRSVHLHDAQNIADRVLSIPLREAVTALQQNREGHFSAFARRFTTTPRRRVLVSIIHGIVYEEDQHLILAPREQELLSLFVLERRPLTRREIVAALWPDAAEVSSRDQLKSLITTLRARFNDKRIIEFNQPVYALAQWVRGDIGDIESALKCELDDTAGMKSLLAYHEALQQRRLRREDSWEWFVPHAYRLEQLSREIALKAITMLLHRNQNHEALELTRKLSADDPCDAAIRVSAIEALCKLGKHAEARQEITIYQRALRDELGIEDDATALVEALARAETSSPESAPTYAARKRSASS